MTRKQTKIEIATTRAREAARALAAAQDAVAQARAAHTEAQAALKRLAIKRPYVQRIEYRIAWLEQVAGDDDPANGNWDCDWANTLREARKIAQRELSHGAPCATIRRVTIATGDDPLVEILGDPRLMADGCDAVG